MTDTPKIVKNRDFDSQGKKRCVLFAEYIIKTKGTVRETAKEFGISKSTVHKDVTDKLMRTDKRLYKEVRKILEKNKEERHLRGGLATKKKYEENKNHIKSRC